MTGKAIRYILAGVAVGAVLGLAGHAMAQSCQALPDRAEADKRENILLSDMGSFFFGGSVRTANNGDTFHSDHGYAQYFVPARSRNLPLVMWHGFGQSGKTWESTQDGRDGFWQMFTRKNWPVYIIDQPRRGRAARTEATSGQTSHQTAVEGEAARWGNFRMGDWRPPAKPEYFPGVQLPQDAASLGQFMRQQVPNSGAEPFPDAAHREFMGAAAAKLFERTGPAILMTHSHSGQYGWVAAMKRPDLVRAIISFEPGEFAFPEEEPPADIPTPNATLARYLAPQFVPAAAFRVLTRMPILILYGDYITNTPSTEYGPELWRMAKLRAAQFVDAVNRHGGDATLMDLPAQGICGNTHFIMSDINNGRVVTQLSRYLAAKSLDGQDRPYRGPTPE